MPPGNRSGPRRRSDERQARRHPRLARRDRPHAEHAETVTYSQEVVFLGWLVPAPTGGSNSEGRRWRDDQNPQTSACSAWSAVDLKLLLSLRRTGLEEAHS